MPKVIDNLRERAVAEARDELLQNGYDALTIRKIAQKLDIGVGTFYNYFPSKEYLAASVMLEDWQAMMADFEADLPGKAPEIVIADLFSRIRLFSSRFTPAWEAYEKKGGERTMLQRYHHSLVNQLSGYLRESLPRNQQEAEPWLVDFLSETVLRIASDPEYCYEDLQPAIVKLLKFET